MDNNKTVVINVYLSLRPHYYAGRVNSENRRKQRTVRPCDED